MIRQLATKLDLLLNYKTELNYNFTNPILASLSQNDSSFPEQKDTERK